MCEIWKDIPGYEGLYQVSDMGRACSLDRETYHSYSGWRKLKGQVLSPCLSRTMLYVGPYISKDCKRFGLHQLVMLAFEGPCPEGEEVCHWDGNPENNRYSNLRYDTHSNNEKDKFRHGTKCKRVLRVEDNRLFGSYQEAAKVMNTAPSNISRAANSHFKACGYTWEPVN